MFHADSRRRQTGRRTRPRHDRRARDGAVRTRELGRDARTSGRPGLLEARASSSSLGRPSPTRELKTPIGGTCGVNRVALNGMRTTAGRPGRRAGRNRADRVGDALLISDRVDHRGVSWSGTTNSCRRAWARSRRVTARCDRYLSSETAGCVGPVTLPSSRDQQMSTWLRRADARRSVVASQHGDPLAALLHSLKCGVTFESSFRLSSLCAAVRPVREDPGATASRHEARLPRVLPSGRIGAMDRRPRPGLAKTSPRSRSMRPCAPSLRPALCRRGGRRSDPRPRPSADPLARPLDRPAGRLRRCRADRDRRTRLDGVALVQLAAARPG